MNKHDEEEIKEIEVAMRGSSAKLYKYGRELIEEIKNPSGFDKLHSYTLKYNQFHTVHKEETR